MTKISGVLLHPKLVYIGLPGLVGGLISWIMKAYPDPAIIRAFETPSIALFLCLIFGIAAAYIVAVILVNPDSADKSRLMVLSFMAGLIWPIIVEKGLGGLAESAGVESYNWSAIQKIDSDVNLTSMFAAKLKPEDAASDERIALPSSLEEEFVQSYSGLVTRQGAGELLVILLAPPNVREEYLSGLDESLQVYLDITMLHTLALISLDDTIEDVTLTRLGRDVAEYLVNFLARQESPSEEITIIDDLTQVLSGEFSDYRDIWYSFEVSAENTGLYQINANSIEYESVSEVRVDPVIGLYASDMSFIGDDDDGGEGLNAKLVEFLSAGTYFVKVSNYEPYRGDYSLELSYLNDLESLPVALVLLPDVHIISLLAGVDEAIFFQNHSDDFWFTFSVDQSGEYLIRTSGQENGPDTVIELYLELEQGLFQIGSDDDGAGFAYYSRLSETLPESVNGTKGKYYLRVSMLGGFVEGAGEVSVSLDRQ